MTMEVKKTSSGRCGRLELKAVRLESTYSGRFLKEAIEEILLRRSRLQGYYLRHLIFVMVQNLCRAL